MRCLKPVSLLLVVLFLTACGRPYRHLQPAESRGSALRFKPEITKEMYRCIVDGKFLFKKFHLSGLLLFKTFDNGSTRAVFQNEMGFSFFDFKWNDRDDFEVMSMIPQLNKPAVIRLLQKDMELIMMKHLNVATEKTFIRNNEIYNRFSLVKGYAYYIVQDDRLKRIENAGTHKVISIDLQGSNTAHVLPETMFFKHHKAHFTIDLKRINAANAE